ncbi:LEA type 2 family protein [Halomicrococcus gelatinilyticus]|uniref:LEA type 2 family protein n=1 Tax=Halomicrococcus gelatinilyticus TaxID=1702103 RepID=UPI002E14A053
MRPNSLLGKILVAIVSLLVVAAGGIGVALASGVVTVQQPTVESTSTEWGTVNEDRTEIRTEVVVDNPNSFRVPGVVDMGYEIGMNDVVVGEGTKSGVGLGTGRSTVSLSPTIDNDKIPAWWATHVNNGEQTTLSVTPSVGVPFYSTSLPAQEQSFSTDLLSAFDSSEPRSLTVDGRTILTATKTEASWGEATEEKTPIAFDATVENPGSGTVEFSKLGYSITMNDVEVANGTTDGTVTIGPESTETIEIDSAMDNGKLPAWWASHVDNDETTTMDVQFYALMQDDGETERVPLSFLSKRVVFTTDVLGGGETQTKVVETPNGSAFQAPTVGSVTSEWVVPDQGDTRVRTTAVVDNPNDADAAFADDLSFRTNYSVQMNDVSLVDTTVSKAIAPGHNELSFSAAITGREVQSWWVSHVNNDEVSQRVVEREVTIDTGFARLPLNRPAERGQFTTDMLAPIDESSTQEISLAGRRVGSVSDMGAEWGEATMPETPIETSATVTNDRGDSFDITEVGYTVKMNDVVLADESKDKSVTVSAHSSKTVEDTIVLDNTKLGDWWKTHVQNDERSTLSVSYYVVVEYRGQTQRIELDSLNYEKQVETDVLGQDSN